MSAANFNTNLLYEVIQFQIGETRAGTKMGKLQLKDFEDGYILNCILWEETMNRIDGKTFRSGNKVKIILGTYNEKFNNCLVSEIELIEEAKRGLEPEELDKVYNELLEYVNKIQDEPLRNFVLEVFKFNGEKIKIAPAARAMHHNYVGGLIVHTLECLKIADKLFEVFYQELNKDEVYAACILHDVGKILEYKIETETGLIDFVESFPKEWISHTQYAFTICMANGFKKVARMIAAHHARTEWGALVDLNEKDLEPYVYLIHHIDDLSAKFGKTSPRML